MGAFDWFWRGVFAWKKETGFVDFGKEIEIEGVVTMIDDNVGSSTDGDYCFNVKLDPGYLHFITTPDGRLTSNDGLEPTMHCEIPPWMHDKFHDQMLMLRVGMRVYVRGVYGFDGVHTGSSEFVEVLKALWRHPANWRQGWFELHPVTHLEPWGKD